MKKIMKVKSLLMAVVFSVAVLGGYQVYEHCTMSTTNILLMENVEALTQAESGSSIFSVRYWGHGNYTCTAGGSSCCPGFWGCPS